MTGGRPGSSGGATQTATAPAPVVPHPRPGDPPITPELVDEHGISPDEYQQILRIMGREPTFTELGVFLGHVVRALRLQELEAAAAATPHAGLLGSSRAPERTRA